MTPMEHYEEAVRLEGFAEGAQSHQTASIYLQRAQLHATLALFKKEG